MGEPGHDLNTGMRRHRLWAVLIAMLVALQFGLLFHQSQHYFNPDSLAGDDCALCQIASGMTAGTAPPVVVLPTFVFLETVILRAVFAPRSASIALPFRPRAPPFALSI